MAAEQTKPETPPYTSYSTFSNFINGLRETGVPSRIDKSVLRTLSGSAQAALIAALKWLKLVDDVGVPTAQLEELAAADNDQYIELLAKIMRARYPFLADGSIVLTKATGHQLEQKFREFGIQGSTVIKCVAFFIAAAKDAKIELGPHVRAPKAPPTNAKRQQSKKAAATTGKQEPLPQDDDDDELGEKPGFVRIPIPLHGMEDGVVYLPDHLSKNQWAYALKITKFILENYRLDAADEEKGEQ